MNFDDLYFLAPIIITAAIPVVLIVLIGFYRSHILTFSLSLIGLLLAFLSLFHISLRIPRQVTWLVAIDGYALLFMGLIFAAAIAVALLSYGYLSEKNDPFEEYYVLLLLAVLGSVVLVSSTHFVSFFLGLELLNISLYALIAYSRASLKNLEAAFKYLILAAVSDAFLLFGMALIYSQTGTMEFSGQSSALASELNLVLLTGMGMVLIGVGFKLAIVPFHMWTPDVYEGASAPITAFVATISKGAVFAVLFRYFGPMSFQENYSFFLLLTMLAVASMFVGNILALLQINIKRLLAYSSIAHMGYLLIAFLATGHLAATAVGYYLIAYFISILGAFGVVTMLSGAEDDAAGLEEYRGLGWRRPWLAGILASMMLSLAGIPLTAGFIGKFYIIAAGAKSALWLLLITLVINSAIGLYYYLRVIVALYSQEEPLEERGVRRRFAGGLVLVVLAVLLIWLGIYPGPFIDLISIAVAGIRS